MQRVICEDCGSLVETQLTHDGVCPAGHYTHCACGDELSPDDLISDDVADRIEELEAKLAWQPIETAPRDGTQFLGWSKLHGVQSCLIQKESAHYKRVEALYGGPQKETWFCPTHWRPLPNGPKN